MSYNPNNPNGQATSANSQPVVIASDQSAVPISSTALTNIDTDMGAQADTAASSDTGTFSLIALIKRLLSKTPALGQAAASASSPVVLANENVQDLYFTGQSAQTATVNNIIPSTAGSSATDATGYRSFSCQVVSTGTAGTFIFEGSNDNTNFQPITVYNQALSNPIPIVAAITATASQITYVGAVTTRYIRLRIATTITGGSIQAFTLFKQVNFSSGSVLVAQGSAGNLQTTATQTGTWTVQIGNTPNTTAILANPVNINTATTGDTGAKTATGNGSTQTNNTAKGANIVFNIGTVSGTSPTCVFKIQGSADGGTTWYDIPGANTASLTATGVYGIIVYPGITAVAGTTTTGTCAAVAQPLPKAWRVVWTIGGTTPSFTITNVQVAYII